MQTDLSVVTVSACGIYGVHPNLLWPMPEQVCAADGNQIGAATLTPCCHHPWHCGENATNTANDEKHSTLKSKMLSRQGAICCALKFEFAIMHAGVRSSVQLLLQLLPTKELLTVI
jgi:hypothetical protein